MSEDQPPTGSKYFSNKRRFRTPCKCNALERWLSNLFYRYGKIVSNRPGLFCFCSFLVALILTLGAAWRFRLIEDEISLYTLTNSEAVKSRAVLDQLFPINESDPFYVERRYEFERAGFLLLNARSHGVNMLSYEALTEASELWRRIKSIHLWYDGAWLNYYSLCIPVPNLQKTCVESPIIALFDANPLMLNDLKYPFDVSKRIFTGEIIGRPRLENGIVKYTQALLLPYQLKHGNPTADTIAEMWEEGLERYLESLKPVKFEVLWWTSETLTIETRKDMEILLRLLAPLFFVVTVFTILCCLVTDTVRSKPILGLGGVVSACFTVVSAIGLMAYLGQGFTTLTYFMPFIIFSIAVDNVFIFLASWHKTSTYLPVSERTAYVLEDVGVSITVTSLTDGISFAVGCFTGFPSVQSFCLYSAVAICFVYFYQLTFFTGMLVLTGTREAQGRHCLICTVDSLKAYEQPLFEADTPDVPNIPADLSEGVQDHILSTFFRTGYADFITSRNVQIVVILVFFLYIGIGIWGCTEVHIGLEPTDLLPKDSLARETLGLRDKDFSRYNGIVNVVFTNLSRDLDYTSAYWLFLSEELKLFENTKFTGQADSWIIQYMIFANQTGLQLTPEDFTVNLKNIFFEKPAYVKYRHDIVFDDDGRKLSAVRFPVQLEFMSYCNHSEAMTMLRNLAKKSHLNATVYADFFNFADQYVSILPMTLINIGIASCAVVAVSLVLIPKPMCAVWVCLSIVSINVGVIGYMSFWGVKLDFVSMVTIVMSIGFCVDFSAHMAYHFAKAEYSASADRIRAALYSVGFPIVQSAVSTILGISFLVVLDNYIYLSFVKTVTLVILLGIFHGLMVLPVLLTLCYREKSASKSVVATAPNQSQLDMVESSTSKIRVPELELSDIYSPLHSVGTSYRLPPANAVLKTKREIKREIKRENETIPKITT